MSLNELSTQKKEVDSFIKSYKGWFRENPNTFLDIENKDLILYFVFHHAIQNDMQWRTLKKLQTRAEVSINQVEKKNIARALSEKIRQYILNGSEKDFDDWHRDTCNYFMSEINNKLLKDKYHPIAYGKAQKAVNMTFKYLSTCSNADEYKERFLKCHIPLDSYILKWYYEKVQPESVKSRRRTWSTLSEEKYFEIQNNIRSYLSPKLPLIEEWSI